METIIGLEVHVSLNTKTKLFCSCPNSGSDIPNTRTCDICVGLPGSKPVLNKKVVEYALRLCMALNCNVADKLIFSRKTYFYPDMGKNYQITQYELPLGEKGFINVLNKKIKITRVHIEEDPAALIHQGSTVLVDYNRSGTPLCEIVTEPDLRSAEEAREFLKNLLNILKYLGIYDKKTCIVKADANVSIKPHERVEIKNINGFKDMERAVVYEIERQKKLVNENQPIKYRETRGWDSLKGLTLFQRKKESEEDYGYIIDSDLVPIEIKKEYINEIKKSLPELPQAKALRFVKEFKIKKEDAEVLADDYDLALLFEKAVSMKVKPEFAAEWVRREVSRVLNYNKKELEETFIQKNLLDVMVYISENKITRQTGQKIMELLVNQDIKVSNYVKEQALETVSDQKELKAMCLKVIRENSKAVEEFKKGNEKSFNFILGQVMRLAKGKADPKTLNEILKKEMEKN